jgi:hypothetical protein
MGFFADFKAKRAAKRATAEFNRLHDIWQSDMATLKKLITVFTDAAAGKDSVPNTLMQKPGEITLWSATGIFHETGRTPSQYVGGSSGVSIPIGGGIRFRVGAMKGQVIPGQELQVDKDQGVVMLTNECTLANGTSTNSYIFPPQTMTPITSSASLTARNHQVSALIPQPAANSTAS